MELIDIIAIASAVIASLTKILDVVSTIRYVPIQCESNPIGRWLFRKFGVAGGCWATFVMMALVIAGVTASIVAFGSFIEKVGLILICLLVLLPFNISTWLLNAKGKSTIFSRIGIKINLKVSKLLGYRR